MELGISSLGHIIESGRTKRDNYSDMIDLLIDATEECLKFSEERNFNVCELIIDPPDIFTDDKKKRFIDLCNSFAIKKQVHGPFIDMGMCSHNDKISQASVESYIETAEMCQEIYAQIMVIHPGVANFLINSIKNYNTNQLIKAVNKLLDAVADLDVIVCMENMPKKALMLLKEKEIEEFFSAVNRNDLFLCYDTSHGWTNDLDVSYLWEKLHKIIKN
ncbi:MAG: sugar phosphate isomerase/epimerase, partial [Promethearchaeota archaeon]